MNFFTELKEGLLIAWAAIRANRKMICLPLLFVVLSACSRSNSNYQVVECIPNLLPQSGESEGYQKELPLQRTANPDAPEFVATNAARGDIISIEYCAPLEKAIVLSCERLGSGWEQWVTGRHIYLFRKADVKPSELDLPFAKGLAIQEVALASQDGQALLVCVCFSTNKWQQPFIITTGLAPNDQPRQIGPGHVLAVSPDGTKLAFLRSDGRGFHSIHMLDTGDFKIRTVMSVWEADPGSGRSFGYKWTTDSRALLIEGRIGGFLASSCGRTSDVRYAFVPATGAVTDLGLRK